MFTARNYVKAASLEEAWQLNQKRANAILGGGCWMRLGKRRYDTLIDLGELGLDTIEKIENGIRIGAMTTLRQLETDPLLREQYGTYFQDSVRHIVGVQFRNSATVGGSVRSRFGFSDVVTALLALPHVEVSLYRGGTVSLEKYVRMAYDRDILQFVTIPEKVDGAVYESVRNSATDLPVLTCAACRTENGYRCAIGGRPGRAMPVESKTKEDLIAAAKALPFGDNMRAGAAYRRHLAGVLTKRALQPLEVEKA